MTRARVLVREQIADAGVELLRERFDVDVDANGDLAATIGDYDAIVIRSATKLTADVIERAERLKVIGRAGVGVDNVDVEAATRRGIVVANAPESTVTSAAEHTVGLLVALARNIPQAHAALKQGRWERSAWGGVELEGKSLGVLGFGRIGRQVARRVRSLMDELLEWAETAGGAEKCCLLVGHSSVNRVLLALILGVDLRDYRRRFRQDWANLTVLHWPERDEGPLLLLANDVSHILGIHGATWE